MSFLRKSYTNGNIWFVVGLVVALFIGWVLFPPALYSSKTQPVDFSHAKHAAAQGLACESCHSYRSDGSYSGIPKTKVCYDCHNEVPNSHDPREKQFIEDYVKPQKEIEWMVYSKQPACVYFSHAQHTKLAKLECSACHAPRETEDTLKPYEENRLTGYSRDVWGPRMLRVGLEPWQGMKMNDCARCHTKMGASNACFVCHK